MAAEADYNPKSGKRSFTVSVFLHGLVLALFVLSAYMKFLFETKDKPQEPDKVFEMISDAQVAQMQEPQPQQSAPQPPDPLQITKPQDVKPIDLPPPPPQPKPEPPVVPTPKPPTPKPTEPKPKETPKQQTVSFDDFRKTHKIPDARPTQARPTKPVNVQQITVNTSRLAPQRSSATPYTGAVSQDEFKAYIAYVYVIAKQNWIAPTEIAGMKLDAKIRLSIDARGKVKSIRILSSSGEKVFDSSIEQLFKSISFNPPPRGEALNVDFVFATTD